jgi:glutamate synthase (NADPH) large chain
MAACFVLGGDLLHLRRKRRPASDRLVPIRDGDEADIGARKPSEQKVARFPVGQHVVQDNNRSQPGSASAGGDLGGCPVGITTQDPELRARFAGTPDHVVRYFLYVAEHVRELMAGLGIAWLGDAIGRADLLLPRPDSRSWLQSLDLSALTTAPPGPDSTPVQRRSQAHGRECALDAGLLATTKHAIAGGPPVVIERRVRNTDRSIGALLAGEIARAAGPQGLPDDTVVLRLSGCAGQSLAAFAPGGLTIDLVGAANDYAGKGLCGGRLIVRPPADAGYVAEENVIVGNTVLYGATAGETFLRGRAGERFAVRNSGARAVVEGVGDHGCEYMTGGVVVVLGPTGRNFAAGMSGGVAYVLDAEGRVTNRCNTASVGLEPSDDADEPVLRELLERHLRANGSAVAARLLADWPAALAELVKVMPDDLRRLHASGRPQSAWQGLEPVGA